MSSLRALLEEAGFHGHGLDTAVAVAMAESGGHPMAHNTNAGTGDNSYGLFQINMLGSLGPARLAEYHLSSNNQLFDPLTNAKVAYRMSQGGTNWTPWSTFKSGAYERYLGPSVDAQVDTSHDPDVVDTPFSSSHSGAGTTLADDPGGHNGTSHGTDFEIGTGHSLTAMDTLSEHHAEELAYSLGYGPKPDPLDLTMTSGGSAGTDPGALGTGTGAGSTDPASQDALQTFLHAAVAQRGDSYVFGAKGIGQADPTAFDCSGLTAWAADQAGVQLPAGAAYQYVALKQQGMTIPVDQAIHTPGALLFHFATEPQPGLQGEPRSRTSRSASATARRSRPPTRRTASPSSTPAAGGSTTPRSSPASATCRRRATPRPGTPRWTTRRTHSTRRDRRRRRPVRAQHEQPDLAGLQRRLGSFHGGGLHPGHDGHGIDHDDHGVGTDDHGLDIGHH